MKAIRIVDMQFRNPDYRSRDHAKARLRGEAYHQQQFLIYPAGSVVEGHGAAMLCLLPTPKAVPADDECRQRVLAAMSSPQLKTKMEQIRSYADPAVFKTLPRQRQAVVRSLIDHWNGTELQKLILGESTLPEVSGASDEQTGDSLEAELSDEELEGLTNPHSDLPS